MSYWCYIDGIMVFVRNELLRKGKYIWRLCRQKEEDECYEDSSTHHISSNFLDSNMGMLCDITSKVKDKPFASSLSPRKKHSAW